VKTFISIANALKILFLTETNNFIIVFGFYNTTGCPLKKSS